MDDRQADILEKVRQQFNFGPYPQIPIEQSPEDDPNLLFVHNFVTSYYLKHHRVASTKEITILDAGCGTGYRTLALARANPGAKVVGIDLSEQSLELARSRLQYHNCLDVQFRVLNILDLPQSGLKFDYINCDEVLYLFPDPAVGLQALKSVLKPNGIIRANLHSALQRADLYRAQAAFRLIGLFDQNPEDSEVAAVQTMMKSLQRWVNVKERTWRSQLEQADATESILMNYLFQGDKGHTISNLIAALRSAELELVRMVNWHQWNVWDLFKDPDRLPETIASRLAQLSLVEKLQLFELLHPVHRLLDFWCTHPGSETDKPPISKWQPVDWAKKWSCVKVYLHPQLRTSQFKEACLTSLKAQKPLILTNYLSAPANKPIAIDTRIVTCLLPLIKESPQPFIALIKRWMELYPRDPISMEPVLPETVLVELKQILLRLEVFLYVLLEED
jgi:2-polyprenyl-3-methyl-5-hydroxy-6-metoxy-1,4-benzoquinol methylase